MLYELQVNQVLAAIGQRTAQGGFPELGIEASENAILQFTMMLVLRVAREFVYYEYFPFSGQVEMTEFETLYERVVAPMRELEIIQQRMAFKELAEILLSEFFRYA
jgi:hypothetical protein